MMKCFFPLLASLMLLSAPQLQAEVLKPELQLAKVYQGQLDISRYYVSEKLDGVRAYWNGHQLVSRQGNIFAAPLWFTANFPDVVLDGELWIARGQFEQVSSIVRRKQGEKSGWAKVKFMIFDLPAARGNFTVRVAEMAAIVKQVSSPYLQMIEQYRLADEQALNVELSRVIALGGEGLMLHLADSFYQQGRTDNVLKVKTYQDGEAKVIAHLPGKGKFTGMLGAIVVRTVDNIEFKIGTGFTLLQRQQPPPIGATITFKHFGKTAKGVPRFASFLRVRR
jgi:DNA ligase-1